METWFANHVLGLCLSVLLLALPGPLRAGTPSSNSTDSATTGFYSSAATDELSDMETNATSASYSSESLSPSQRNILLTRTAETHTAAAENFDSEQPHTVTETSSRSLDATSLSTEPLASTLVVATTEASSSSSSSGSSSSSISSSSISSSSSSSSISSSSIGSSSSISSSSISSISSSISSNSISSSSTSSSSIRSSSIGSSISSSSSSGSISSSSSSISSSSGSSSIRSSSIGSIGSSSSSDWKDYLNTEQVSDTSHVVSPESSSWMLTEEARMPQDSPDTTLRQGDASPSMSHTAVHTDSSYTSTTISRTLLSVTSSSSNSTFSTAFTEDSNSQKPPSTWAIPALATETEDYTHSAPSARTDHRDTTDQGMTHSFRGMFSETGTPGGSERTQSYDEQRGATRQQPSSTSEETSDSTPTLRVTEPSTDHQSEVSVSSTPPITPHPEGPANISGTDQNFASSVGTSTESSTGVQIFSTQNQESTDVVSSQASEPSLGQTLTTGPPTASTTSVLDHSLTDASVLATEVFLSTTGATVTERPHVTEENMSAASTSISTTATATTTTTTTPRSLLPSTSSSRFRGISSSTVPSSSTEATILYTPPSTTASTQALQTTAAHPTHRMSSSQTQRPSTRVVIPTKVTTLQTETSTVGLTTAQSQHIATTDARNTPTRSTESLQTTQRHSDRGTTEMVVTTSPTDTTSTKALLPRNPCASNPCLNGGMCVSDEGHQFTCICQDAWTGQTCSHDVDECENDPCPSGSRCVNTRGSFSCECPLGFDLADGRTCTRAKAFLGTFSINRLPHDPVHFKSTTVHEIQREIVQLLNASLSALQGYSRSLLSKREEDGLRISAVNMFFLSADVTSAEVYNSIQMFLSNCSSSLAHCRVVLHHQLTYHAESLCSAQKTQCDTERSTCTDSSGTAQCQCHQGYYKHNPDDLSCLDCGDGYKLENGSCVPCTFGFGGFNCGNFYKLIAVVVSPAGGALLLIMIIALIVTCCKKDKNDINKIIFKSGDLQMSPYADFPKSNRISMEWGRETIEMQENGSTKNLLQMTDIYYSPVLRNSDLDRNGLYPFTGLPGSRHSCIYPAQWNPSFISDDSRRRDYF